MLTDLAARLTESIIAAGIPIRGLVSVGPKCRLRDDDRETLPPEQATTAEAMIAAWDWTPPPAAKPAKTLEQIYMATPLEQRTPVWIALLEWTAAKAESDEAKAASIMAAVQADPKGAQEVLDRLGVKVKIVEGE